MKRLHLACSAFLLVSLAAPTRAGEGGAVLTVRDGRLLRQDKPFRAFGINCRDLLDEILAKGEAATDSFDCIRYLGEKRIPFIRTWMSYFGDYKQYHADPATYWRHMDLFVAACERADVGIAPTLFWCKNNVPPMFGEFVCDWADPDSQTRAFMETYTRELISRYRDRPVFWFWEFTNEDNLMWDLPNGTDFLPKDGKDARNLHHFFAGKVAIRAFARAVRRLDAVRPLSSGCTGPRPTQFHQSTTPPGLGDPWTGDTPEQNLIAAGWTCPEPVDLYSMHYYARHQIWDGEKMHRDVSRQTAVAAHLGKVLYLGELGVLDGHGKMDADFDETLYRVHCRELLEACYRAKVPLAAWWCYAVKPNGYHMGTPNPKYGKFEYILDFIAEYNAKMAQDLETEAR